MSAVDLEFSNVFELIIVAEYEQQIEFGKSFMFPVKRSPYRKDPRRSSTSLEILS